MTAILHRAFAVWLADLDRWDPMSFHGIDWKWPDSVMCTVGSVLSVRKERVDRTKYAFSELQPITIHFDGSVDRRAVDGNREYSMDLFHARPGDIVVAKIDLKNGAVGIVPDWKNVVVTGHFAVYEPDRTKVVPEYFERIIQAPFFKAYLWRNKVGAEGRKEVKLDFFEAVTIPLPPLATQRVILAQWQKARAAIAAAEESAWNIEADMNAQFFADLGLYIPTAGAAPKSFAVYWRDTFTWSGRATFLWMTAGSLRMGRYPVVTGRDIFREVRHGCSASPSPKPSGLSVLKISAVTRGEFDPSERKHAVDNPRVRDEFDLRSGDILLCRTNGTLAYVAMSALVRDDMKDLIFPDKVIRLRVKDGTMPDYVWHVLKTPHLRMQIEAAARTAVGNYAIGTSDIWGLRLPLPPLTVQRRIMEKVAAGRARIACERETARALAQQIEADMEAYLLGTKEVTGAA